ncbi:MAG TPA: thioesterase family protein, partial [Phenylobacterium sp.]
MGHLNVRFWGAKAQEGLAGLAAQLGMPRAFAADGEATVIVREQHIRFLREAHAGAALSMTGGVVEMGETDARLILVIRHPDGRPAATFQLVVEHVTSKEMRPFAWSAPIRERAAGLMTKVPDFAAARSIDLSPVTSTASLQRALGLDLKRIGLGVIGPAECDVFGRMRPEIFIGRVSDGVGRLFGETRPGPASL